MPMNVSLDPSTSGREAARTKNSSHLHKLILGQEKATEQTVLNGSAADRARVARAPQAQKHRRVAKSMSATLAQRGPPVGTCFSIAQRAAQLADRDRLVVEYLPSVKAIAMHMRANLPAHVDVDDLVHAGILGLLEAANKFDPSKHVTFFSYARHRIKGAIMDSLRRLDWASRNLRRGQRQVEAATRDLTAVLQRAPTEAETALKLGIDVERLRKTLLGLRVVRLVSATNHNDEDDNLPFVNFPSKLATHPDSMFAGQELGTLLGEAMKSLSERSQKIVVWYYTNELTMKKIAGMLGINESRVSQLHKEALRKMSSALHHSGIDSIRAF
jgi:RNA polymerase sigma factor FliA